MAIRPLAKCVLTLVLTIAPSQLGQPLRSQETKKDDTKTSSTSQSDTPKVIAAQRDEKKEAEPKKKKWSSTKLNEITFDDLKFDIEKDGDFERDMLTDSIEGLDDKRVRLRGWILPLSVFQQKGIRSFILVRDNMECCFGPGALIFDCVKVEMVKGKSTNFTTQIITVEGEFSVKEYKYPDGEHYAIYRIKGTTAK